MPDDADRLVKQRHVQDGPASKRDATYGPSSTTGDSFIDRGAMCDQHGGPGCMLSREQRQRLVLLYMERVSTAANNYNQGLAEVRLDVLMEKEDDLSWVAMLALNIATDFAASALTSALTGLKKAGESELADLLAHEVQYQVDSAPRTVGQKLQAAFASVSDARIKEQVKKATESTKKKTIALAKKPQGVQIKKAESVAFLQELQSAASVGFQQIREHVPEVVDDAELFSMYQAFDVNNHQIEMYHAAIADKLQRYRDSGVSKIGISHEYHRGDEDADVLPRGEVIRDVRVVWLEFESGYPRKLAFQHQDGRVNPDVIRPDDPMAPPSWHKDRAFGPHDAITDKPEPGLSERSGTNFYVPDEFVDTAIARHKQVWKTDPPVVHVDDSTWNWEPARVKAAQERKRQRQTPATKPRPLPRPPAPVVVPDALKLKPPGGST